MADPRTPEQPDVAGQSDGERSAPHQPEPRALFGATEDTIVLRTLAAELDRIEAHLRKVEVRYGSLLQAAAPDWTESARNLLHYTALRQLDLRKLQVLLQQEGLSSLGRSESFVMASLLEVRLRITEALLARGEATRAEIDRFAERRAGALSGGTAQFLLHTHTHQMFGPKPEGRHVYVMVTAPDAAEADQAWHTGLLRAGMNVLRINCAHEGPEQWSRIIECLGAARRETGRDCRILMDLGGPKIRTGPIAGNIQLATWKLHRDELGRLVEPTRITLRSAAKAEEPADGPVIVLNDAWLADLHARDVLRFRDTRGKKRTLVVRTVAPGEAIAIVTKRAYLLAGTPLELVRRGRVLRRGKARIAGASRAAIPLAVGDLLILTERAVPGRPADRGDDGTVVTPATVACTAPGALARVAAGHRVLFDDGKIEGVVERVDGADLHVRIRHTAAPIVKLRAEKGINLPDSPLPIAALTSDDRAHLPFVARHADVVGLSFVRSPADVRALHAELAALQRTDVGLVLKIETAEGFANLARILLEAMRRPPVAVMIARGDLAVELGFERLAEVQEEILWLCEASHVPAVWATQVLDRLARTGVPSRAEITDAAASVAAECVMLNKGPFVVEALRALVDILQRMERHHYKKRSLFRRLHVSALDAPA